MRTEFCSTTFGRFLTTDPIPGGNANTYIYPDDPINGFDLNGQCWGCGWIKKHAGTIAKVAAVAGLVALAATGVGALAEGTALATAAGVVGATASGVGAAASGSLCAAGVGGRRGRVANCAAAAMSAVGGGLGVAAKSSRGVSAGSRYVATLDRLATANDTVWQADDLAERRKR